MNEEVTTGSLDTNVRLLAQRITLGEADLKRLGDSVGLNSRDINRIDANATQNDKVISYRIGDIEKRINNILEAEKAFKNWLMGILGGLVITFLMALFELLRKR